MREERYASPVTAVEIRTYVQDADGTERLLDRQVLTGEPEQALPPVTTLDHPADGITFGHHHFSAPGTVKIETHVDEAGRPSRIECFSADGARTGTIIVEYDDSGRETRIVHDDGLAEVITTYEGNVTERTTLLLGMTVTRRRTTRDDRGHVVSEETIDQSGTRRMRHEYVLNDRGDWIEQRSYPEGAAAPSLRTVRAITYRDEGSPSSVRL
jgi:hypothetical protein